MTGIVIKLKDGMDVTSEIEKIAREQKLDYGLYVSASGKLKDVELLTMLTRGRVNKETLKDVFIVNSISGKIQKKGTSFSNDINVSLVKGGLTAFSGRLIKANVSEGLEIAIRSIPLNKIIEA